MYICIYMYTYTYIYVSTTTAFPNLCVGRCLVTKQIQAYVTAFCADQAPPRTYYRIGCPHI